MKIKSLVAGVLATGMVAVFIPMQASACGERLCGERVSYCGGGIPWHGGWHCVPASSCAYRHAMTWQQYNSGGYLPPDQGYNRGRGGLLGGGFLFF